MGSSGLSVHTAFAALPGRRRVARVGAPPRPATLRSARRDNHSAISKILGSSSAVDISVVLSIESGSLREAANRRACSKQRRVKAATNALERERCECPDLKLHPRKVAQSVVIVGPPRREAMLREVVAIGRC